MSIRRFAKPLGVNHETLRRYMHNGRVPASVLARIAARYDVDCNWLLTGVVKEKGVFPAGNLANEHRTASIVAACDRNLQECQQSSGEHKKIRSMNLQNQHCLIGLPMSMNRTEYSTSIEHIN